MRNYFFSDPKKEKKKSDPSRDFDPRQGAQSLQGVQWKGRVVFFRAPAGCARHWGFPLHPAEARTPERGRRRKAGPRPRNVPRAHPECTPPLPSRARSWRSGARAPPRSAARGSVPPAAEEERARAARAQTSGPPHRTCHPATSGPSGGQARAHRTVRHSWRRTRAPRRRGPARAAPRRAAAARAGSRRCGRERRHAPCGRGHSPSTLCVSPSAAGDASQARPFRASRRADNRAKAGEGRPAPPHAHRAHRAPRVRPQRLVDLTFPRGGKVG